MSLGLDDIIELYVDLKGLKKEIRAAGIGDEIRTPGVEVRIEGTEGELALVYAVTRARKSS